MKLILRPRLELLPPRHHPQAVVKGRSETQYRLHLCARRQPTQTNADGNPPRDSFVSGPPQSHSQPLLSIGSACSGKACLGVVKPSASDPPCPVLHCMVSNHCLATPLAQASSLLRPMLQPNHLPHHPLVTFIRYVLQPAIFQRHAMAVLSRPEMRLTAELVSSSQVSRTCLTEQLARALRLTGFQP